MHSLMFNRGETLVFSNREDLPVNNIVTRCVYENTERVIVAVIRCVGNASLYREFRRRRPY